MKTARYFLVFALAFGAGLGVAAVPNAAYESGQPLTATVLQNDFSEIENRLVGVEKGPPVFGSDLSETTIGATDWTSVGSVSITTVGNRGVRIELQPNSAEGSNVRCAQETGGPTCHFRFVRDGTVVGGQTISQDTGSQQLPPSSISFLDPSVAPGVWTYTFEVKQQNATIQFFGTRIVATEL